MRALHRVRESFVQDKVKTTNQMHAFLLESGIGRAILCERTKSGLAAARQDE